MSTSKMCIGLILICFWKPGISQNSELLNSIIEQTKTYGFIRFSPTTAQVSFDSISNDTTYITIEDCTADPGIGQCSLLRGYQTNNLFTIHGSFQISNANSPGQSLIGTFRDGLLHGFMVALNLSDHIVSRIEYYDSQERVCLQVSINQGQLRFLETTSHSENKLDFNCSFDLSELKSIRVKSAGLDESSLSLTKNWKLLHFGNFNGQYVNLEIIDKRAYISVQDVL